MESWFLARSRLDPEALKGRPSASLGMDLSSTTDTEATRIRPATVPLRMTTTRERRVVSHIFIPEDNLAKRVKRDRVAADVWKRNGLLHDDSRQRYRHGVRAGED